MTQDELIEYCLKKQGAYLDFPFGEGCAIVKIKTDCKRNGIIFMEVFCLQEEEKFTFGTDGETALFLRNSYPENIVRGYHCPPVQAKYKSTANLKDLSDDIIKKLADMSYARAYSKLTKKEKESLEMRKTGKR